MLCRASLSSPDLGVAIKRWCRHHRLLTSDIALELQVAGGLATVSIRENADLGELREFCLVSNLRFLHGYAPGSSIRGCRCAQPASLSRPRRTAMPIR